MEDKILRLIRSDRLTNQPECGIAEPPQLGRPSERSVCSAAMTSRATIRLWNGNEKAGRHDLSAMPSCGNQSTSLWGRAFWRPLFLIE